MGGSVSSPREESTFCGTMAEQAPRPKGTEAQGEEEARPRKASVKTLVADGDGERPFMRGIMVHSLLARGLSFEEAFRMAGAVRERIRLRPVVTREELRALIDEIAEPG